MSMVDPWTADAFTMASMVEAVNKLPHKPTRIEQMGLFQPKPIATRIAIVEERSGILELVPTTEYGGPASLGKEAKRTVRTFNVPHLALEDTILAESVQGVRQFGSEDELQGVSAVVNERMLEMKDSIAVTKEHLMAGALAGVLLDADGETQIYSLFTQFGITQTSVDFLFGTSTTNILAKCLDVARAVEVALGASAYEHIHCLCGSTFFNLFTGHALVKTAYERWQNGEFLRSDNRAGFKFGEITFEEYRGTVSGVPFFTATEARFFPVGVQRLFQTVLAPADFNETANTLGLPIYAKSVPVELNRGMKIHVQSNPLPLCMRPAVLVRGWTSN